MPRLDRTGPQGFGPRTGRGLGPCGRDYAFGRGWGDRFGWGFGAGYGPIGFGPGWFASRQWTKEDEKQALASYRQDLEEELAEVKKAEEELAQSK
ncbi:DUF5320 domain-containing protein [Patescibacteria group bacterium]|nr:DUF5320 domain-containing protein [Patescibacteria group bacterium]